MYKNATFFLFEFILLSFNTDYVKNIYLNEYFYIKRYYITILMS